MCIKFPRKSARGFTLVEVLIASCLFGIASVAVCSLYLYSTKAFISLTTYADLDRINRLAMDTLTAEIRQANMITTVTTNSLVLRNQSNQSVTYRFDAKQRQMIRVSPDGQSKVLVSDCELLQFDVFQRNNIATTWDQYPVADRTKPEQYVKVVQLTWKAYHRMPAGMPGVSENVQTAKIIIRNQH